jgi:carboxypeptidase Q
LKNNQMKKNILSLAFPLIFICSLSAQNKDSVMMRKIANEILLHGKCYSYLDYLSNKIGGRLTGSPQAAAAVEYTYQLMETIGADSIFKQECMVPHWVRGAKETAKILTTQSGEYAVNICALGRSVATPVGGITANVVEVDSLGELKKLGRTGIEGKIVFFNGAFDETEIETFAAYGKAVVQRWNGPSEAAKYGAVGTVVRSMTNTLDDYPHTGSMQYNDSFPKVPCCAISTIGAELLDKELKVDPKSKFHFEMSCQTLPDEKSCNVVAEIRGTEHPDEYITIGGHLDSWDLAQGSQDDGAGIVQTLEVLRTFKALGIKPKRTIRFVMFMNEENGEKGALKYAELAKLHHENHIAAIESDAGGYSPRGFGVGGATAKRNKILSWRNLFLPYGIYDFSGSEGGTDIEPLESQGTVMIGLSPDSQRYFDIHHTAADTFDKVNKRELELGAAGMTMLVYLLAEYGLN